MSRKIPGSRQIGYVSDLRVKQDPVRFSEFGCNLSDMSSYSTRFLAALSLSLVGVHQFFGQSATNTQIREGVVLTKLFQPIYPPLARQTHIMGDVEITVNVTNDGSVDSATVVDGPLLLTQAALESAKHSQFDCRNCAEGLRSFQLVYSFHLVPASCAAESEMPNTGANSKSYPQVLQTQNHVAITDRAAIICDPAIDRRRVRSAKCLYLWTCGWK